MMNFKQITDDHGTPKYAYASDNKASYILTSAYAKDMYNDFIRKYDRFPTAKWLNKHFSFVRIKLY